MRRQGLAVLGPEDEVRVGGHVDGAEVYEQVVGDFDE